ncbi:MAG: MFS transporter [Desulfobacteraceae bacterium]|nr:MFS transporter [Desulfobacteraceae bacterium]
MSERNNQALPPVENKFYGWWIVFAGFIILFVTSGIGFYSHSVILDPLRELHAWSKGTVSAAVTLFFFANGITGLVLGRWIDRYGPKWFLILGSMIFGAALYTLTRINNLPQLFAVYLMMSFGYCSSALIPVNTLITNWFIRKRGLAMSIANTGLSVGGMILVPLSSYLILHLGLDRTLLILGSIYMLVIIPITLIFIQHRPSDINQYPDGLSQQDEPTTRDRKLGKNQMNVWSRKQAMKTMAFWSIALAFMLALAGQIAYLVHQVSFLSQYLGLQKAASTVSITAGASIVGRLVLGRFVDSWDNRYVIMSCVIFQGIAVITLAFYNNIVILYLCTFIFGLTMGPLLMMQSLIIGECFGIPSFAAVSGAIGLITITGAAFGPVIAGIVFDMTQSYQWSFMLFASASFLSAGIIYFARPPALK